VANGPIERGLWSTAGRALWFAPWLALGCGLVAIWAGAARGEEKWKTGVEFRQRLAAPVDIHWPDNPLRSSLANLAHAQGVAIFLDRRLDPERAVQLEVRAQTLQTALDRLTGSMQAGNCAIGPLIYIAPPSTAAKLATLAAVRRQEAASLPPPLKAKLLKVAAWQWSDLAMPRALLAELASQAGLPVENPQLVPHDLWPAASLPPLARADRLTVLLAGFGLTYELPAGSNSIRLRAMPAAVVYEREYTTRGDAAKATADLQRMFPEAKLTRSGPRIRVAGAFEDHEKIERLLRGERVRTTQTKPGQKRYTLKVENQPAGGVIKAIAKDLGKEMKYSPELVEKLNHKVSFSLDEVSLEELLQATLRPLGLSYNLTDEALEIVAGE
jgi:hypothetical protein